VVNIGIGGSDLGPRVATEALTIGRTDARMEARFLSNVDGHAFQATMQGLDPARTLFLVASKTFTTLETRTNAAAARAWIAAKLGEAAVGRHFAALSPAEFLRWWSLGQRQQISDDALACAGRYCCMVRCQVGPGDRARRRVGEVPGAAGRRLGDGLPLPRRAAAAEPAGAAWAGRGLERQCAGLRDALRAGLRRSAAAAAGASPATRDGEQRQARDAAGTPTGWDTCPILFSEPGTNAQHSFMQLVHQGTRPVPVDFILAANPDHDRVEAHRALAANAFAQAEALPRSAGGGDQGGDGRQGRDRRRRSMPWRRIGCASASGRRTPFCSGAWTPSVWGG
jgi:glucose-6-phosphate isomerase